MACDRREPAKRGRARSFGGRPGKPQDQQWVRVNTYIPQKDRKALEERAFEQERSMASVLREALELYLARENASE